MAQKIDSFEFRAGPHNTYPWDEWLDGDIWELEQGEDFQTTPNKFRTTVYQAARRNNKVVRTSATESKVVLQVVGELNETSSE